MSAGLGRRLGWIWMIVLLAGVAALGVYGYVAMEHGTLEQGMTALFVIVFAAGPLCFAALTGAAVGLGLHRSDRRLPPPVPQRR